MNDWIHKAGAIIIVAALAAIVVAVAVRVVVEVWP